MNCNLEWFEALCDGLSKNPVAASKMLEQFRESDVAIEACATYLTSLTISNVALFQAVSILQRAAIVRWETLPVEKRAELRNRMIETLSRVVSNQSPQFILNKVMQVCASIWKRGWLQITTEDKDAYLHFIQGLMQDPSTSRFATSLLRVTLEEFGQQSFAEINMQFAFHAEVKRSFQKNDLNKAFALAVQPLNILLSWKDAASIATHLPLLTELFKLLSELISWNFKEDSLNSKNATDDQAMQASQCNKLPREWGEHLISADFVNNLFTMYQSLSRNPQAFGAIDMRILQSCALELRNLILCLPTIDGEAFTTPDQKLTFGNHILECAITLVVPSIPRTESAALAMSDSCTDYEEGGLRQEQLELYLNLFLRVVNNYKVQMFAAMPQFEPSMLHLGNITREVCAELAQLAQQSMQGYERWLSQQTHRPAGSGAVYDPPVDVLLMNTWRGDVLALALDAWALILDSPCISLHSTGTVPSAASAGMAVINPQFTAWVKIITQEIFQSSFQGVFLTLIFETLSGAEKEENEEDALIESRETGDLLVGICTLGRASFPAAVSYLLQMLQGSVAELHSLAAQPLQVLNHSTTSQMQCLRALEKCRICVEFCSYLCVENFHDSASQMGKETPIVNEHILLQLSTDGAAVALLRSMIVQIAALLQWETQLVITHAAESAQSHSSATHPLQSPYLLEAVYRYFTEYVLRFMDPDPELYSDECLQAAGALLQSFHGTEINSVLEVTLQCTHHVIQHMPLETELVAVASQYLVALSASRNPARLHYLVASEHTHRIAQYTTSLSSTSGGGGAGGAASTGAGAGGQQGVCRLNGTGLSAMFEALGQLFVRARNEAFFSQLCGAVFALVEGHAELSNRTIFQRVLCALAGLAKCSAGLDGVLYGLFDACWPTLRASIRLYVDADDILKQFLLLLQLYAEHQISRLPSQSCLALYQTAYEVFSIYHKRFALCEARGDSVDEENVLFRNESCLHVLELLNHLSSKDFSFTEDCAEQTNQTFEREVAAVLLHGLQLIIPVLTVETLHSFPVLSERFFSFMAFMLSSYVVDIARWVNALPPAENQRMLFEIVGRLQCGCGVVEAPTARLALHALQSIATHQWKCLAGQVPGHSNVPFAAAQVLAQVTDSLLQSILSASAAGGSGNTAAPALLSWDRTDSLGNVLITFVALDNSRYTSVAQYLVSQQAPSVQATLLQALTRLSTARSVNMQAIDKANRQKFVLNFREFVTQIKSLSLT